MRDPTPENHLALKKEIDFRMKVDKTFADIFPQYMSAVKNGEYPKITQWGCYKEMIEQFEETCFKLDDYAMKYLGAMVHQCESQAANGGGYMMKNIKAKMASSCNN
jgi:hypothetical protein